MITNLITDLTKLQDAREAAEVQCVIRALHFARMHQALSYSYYTVLRCTLRYYTNTIILYCIIL